MLTKGTGACGAKVTLQSHIVAKRACASGDGLGALASQICQPSHGTGYTRRVADSDASAPTAKPSAAAPRQRTRAQKIRAWLAPLIAIGLLGWVFDRYDGVAVLQQIFEQIGWDWPLLLIPYAAIAVITIFAYRWALPDRGRAIPFWVLLQIERSGSAMNALLPLGNQSSQLVKLAVMRHWYSSEEIVGTAAWTSLATGNANAFAALGPAVCLAVGFGDPLIVGILLAVAVGMSVPTLTILYFLPRGLPQRVASLVTRLPGRFVAKRKDKWMAWAARLDKHVVAAVTTRRRDYLRLLGMRLLGQAIRIGELWLVVELLGLPGGIMTAFLINALSRAVQQLGGFVPGRLGVMEWVSAETFAALGFTEADGLAVALTLRLRYFANLIVSFGALTGLNHLAEKYPPRAHGPSALSAEEAIAEMDHNAPQGEMD